MKYFLPFFLFFICISGYAQQHKNGVVKINGDTIWADKVDDHHVGGRVKKLEMTTGGVVTLIDGKELAFVFQDGKSYLIGSDSYWYGEIVIVGTNYYLTCQKLPGANSSVPDIHYNIMDKNRVFQQELIPQKNLLFKALRKYFNDCEEFTKYLSVVEGTFKEKNATTVMEDLIAKYNSTCAAK